MKVYFQNTLIYDRSFEGVSEVLELMAESPLDDDELKRRHDITGVGIAAISFLLTQILAEIRARKAKNNIDKQAEEVKAKLREFEGRLQEVIERTSSENNSDSETIVKAIYALIERDEISIIFEHPKENDLRIAFETLKKNKK
jgi:hypothetical protein